MDEGEKSSTFWGLPEDSFLWDNKESPRRWRLRDIRNLISWNALSQKEFDREPFLLNPYIPVGGITFMWGDTSVGKSPLGWHMAAAVGSGTPFFGLPTSKGKVLYIELDTPERLVAERLKKLQLAPGAQVDFLFLPPLSIPVVAKEDFAMLNEAAENGYDLVIVNTLRKCHSLNDKEAQTPKLVYEFFQRTFPGSALVFVHHSKKSQLNQASGSYENGLDKESFSGAKNWLNDAQVGLYLKKYKNPRTNTNLALRHEKTQVSAEYAPLLLRLEADGSNISCPEAEQLSVVRGIVEESEAEGLGPSRIDQRISAALNLGLTQSRDRRLIVTNGKDVWLKEKQSDETNDEE